LLLLLGFFAFNSASPPETFTLSLHDALPICGRAHVRVRSLQAGKHGGSRMRFVPRSGEPAGRRDSFLSERHQPAQAESLAGEIADRKSTRLNSSHVSISYAVFCLKKKKKKKT